MINIFVCINYSSMKSIIIILYLHILHKLDTFHCLKRLRHSISKIYIHEMHTKLRYVKIIHNLPSRIINTERRIPGSYST